MDGHPQRRVVPEFRIAEYGGDPEAGRADLAEEGERVPPFLLKAHG
jgi:hypothetical protein